MHPFQVKIKFTKTCTANINSIRWIFGSSLSNQSIKDIFLVSGLRHTTPYEFWLSCLWINSKLTYLRLHSYDNKTCIINYGDKAVHTQSRIFLFNLVHHYWSFCNFWGVTPRPFKCEVFRWWATDFSFEFIKLLQNDFSKQRYKTLNASIPG